MTTTNVRLTVDEIRVLEKCLNCEDRESQLKYYYIDKDVSNIATRLGWTRQKVGGVLSNLRKMDMVIIVDGRFDELVYLTPEGVNAIFDVIDVQQQ